MKANLTLILLILFSSLFSQDKSGSLHLFATGELHGAIDESSIKKSGGIVGMSHFLKRHILTTDLLLDAGGFAAGGLYDFGISGYLSDSLRTDIICSQISDLNYTAVTLGDDDLAWGAENIITWKKRYSLPFVSANVSFSKGRKPLPYIYIKEKNLFITGVTTSKPLVPPGEGVTVHPIGESLSTVVKAAPRDATVLLLAHLTPEEIDSVLLRFPRIDIVQRGHRHGGEEPVETIRDRPVLSFGFEGTKIVSAEITDSGVDARWIPVEAHPFTFDLSHSKEVFDLVIMSGCPYAFSAIDEFLTFQEKSRAFQWNLWFSGTIQGDSIQPGLPAGDLNWELSILAVKELYPKQFHDFLWLLIQEEYTPARAMEEMQFSLPKINSWIESEGREILRLHYRRADRLAVTSSPTLFINNRLYNGAVNSNRFLFELCGKELEKGAICGSFGECLTDGDCSSSTGVSRCEGKTQKKCVTYEDVAFKIVQILPDDSGYSAENSFTQTTKNLFPKAEVVTIRQSSLEAETTLEKFNAIALPFYLIDTTIVTSINYHSVAEGIQRQDDRFTFKPGFMTGNYYLKRTEIPGDIKLFVDIESDLYQIISQENLKIYPTFSKELLLNNSTRISPLLKELNISDSPDTYYQKYLEGIVVGAPVYVLYNNNQVREIHSQAEFETFLQKDMK